MKNKLSLPVVIAFLMIVFSSCKQHVPQLALYVPKNAASVLIIDVKSVTDKINSSGITLDSLANIFSKNQQRLHWTDIENSGIDLTKSVFVFTKQTNAMQTGKTQSIGLIAEVNDKNKLEIFFKKQIADAVIKTENTYQYVDLPDGFVAGWNDKIMIISSIKSAMQSLADEAQSHQQLTALFTQTKANSVASINEFNKSLDKRGDIHFWLNSSASLSAMPMIGMTKASSLFEDTYTNGTIDFENGKAIATAETHFNKTMSDILEKYPSKEIDKSMITRYPQPVSGFGIVAFNPKILLDILHYLGFDMMTDGYVSQMGFNTSDVVNAFSGDIAVMFSDVSTGDHAIPGMQLNKPYGAFLLNAAIGDKAAFDKVMNGLVSKNILSKNGDEYQLGFFGGHDFVIETTDKNLFVASSDTLIRTYKSNTNKSALSNDVEKEIDNKSMSLYTDISALLQKSNTPDTASLKVLNTAQSTFKNFIASVDKTDDKSTKSNLELNFVNTNENSLASLVRFMCVAHNEKMKHKDRLTAYPPLSNSNNVDSSNERDSQ